MLKDRIKELREKNNLTVATFAKSLGVSTVSVRQYESGRQNPGKKTIQKICEVYGVDEAWLTDATPENVTETTSPATIETAKDEKKDKPVEKKRRQGRKAKSTDTTVTEEEMKSEQEVDKIPDATEIENNNTVKKAKKEEKPVEKKDEIDISKVLARVAEIGVRKAAAEVGVAWQTVNKWKKDAEKTSAALEEATKELPASADIEKAVTETIIETVDENSDKKEKKDAVDINAVLARAAEIGVRKAAAEVGVAWQTVTKWKKDAEKAAIRLAEATKEMPASEDIEKAVTETIIEAVDENSDKKEEKNTVDINAVLARAAEIGVRKAAAEFGVAWQTVNKWKKDTEKAAAALEEIMKELPTMKDIKESVDELTTPDDLKEGLEAFTKVVEMVESEPAKEEKEEEKKNTEIDIAAVLSRVAEIGVRKAAKEIGVAWQTVTKWKKDAEKAAAGTLEEVKKELPKQENIKEAVAEELTLNDDEKEGAEITAKDMKNIEPAPEEKKQNVNETKEEKKDTIDIAAVLNLVAQIGVRKAAKEIGVAWQTVNKWKKDAEKATAEEKKGNKDSVNTGDVIEKPVTEKRTKIIIQSPMGGAITPKQIIGKIPEGSDSVYVRVDENKLYWVKDDESGAVDIW